MYFLEKISKKIRLFITDVDGVLTDGKITYTENGSEIKSFNVKDGLGIKLLHNVGIYTAIITSRKSKIVEKRGKELNFSYIYQGEKNKLDTLSKLSKTLGVSYSEILYIGDDLVDLPVLRRVGFPVCTPSSPDIVKRHCIYITEKEGGEGAVREVVDLLLELRGDYDKAIQEFLI